MTATTLARASRRSIAPAALAKPYLSAPVIVGALAFAALFYRPFVTVVRDWIQDPEAAHGLLLAPLAVYFMWKSGIDRDAAPQRRLGLAILIGAVLLRLLSGLAAELFTMRMSMLLAGVGLVTYAHGLGQIRRWWLPVGLLVLAVPLPALITASLAFPLQLQASRLGATLLEWRHVPVLLAGNVIQLPGRSLFVTEACSGLRSLTALVALGFLAGGLWLRSPWMRALLVLATLPVAVLLNGVRVFLTGFLVFFVDPQLGEGFMHLSEGWLIFVVAFAIIGGIAAVLLQVERLIGGRRA